jgi:hypothetical protein
MIKEENSSSPFSFDWNQWDSVFRSKFRENCAKIKVTDIFLSPESVKLFDFPMNRPHFITSLSSYCSLHKARIQSWKWWFLVVSWCIPGRGTITISQISLESVSDPGIANHVGKIVFGLRTVNWNLPRFWTDCRIIDNTLKVEWIQIWGKAFQSRNIGISASIPRRSIAMLTKHSWWIWIAFII